MNTIELDKRIKRIKDMERRFDRVRKAEERLRKALISYSKVQDDIRALDTYYNNGWR